ARQMGVGWSETRKCYVGIRCNGFKKGCQAGLSVGQEEKTKTHSKGLDNCGHIEGLSLPHNPSKSALAHSEDEGGAFLKVYRCMGVCDFLTINRHGLLLDQSTSLTV